LVPRQGLEPWSSGPQSDVLTF